MDLHSLPKSTNKRGKGRIGRGGKRGTYSGRGQKGQKSRAGHVIRPAERDLIIRLPKRRGFRNKPKSKKPFILNLSDFNGRLKAAMGDKKILDKDLLKSLNILPSSHRGDVKILGKGEINFALIINKDILISESAKVKIEKAGGKIEPETVEVK